VQHKSEEDAPSLPAGRAFVVQFSTKTDIERGPLIGRVEHVVSGQASHFQLLDELLAFIGHLLTTIVKSTSHE
jgi:hypothetical protein